MIDLREWWLDFMNAKKKSLWDLLGWLAMR